MRLRDRALPSRQSPGSDPALKRHGKWAWAGHAFPESDLRWLKLESCASLCLCSASADVVWRRARRGKGNQQSFPLLGFHNQAPQTRLTQQLRQRQQALAREGWGPVFSCRVSATMTRQHPIQLLLRISACCVDILCLVMGGFSSGDIHKDLSLSLSLPAPPS